MNRLELFNTINNSNNKRTLTPHKCLQPPHKHLLRPEEFRIKRFKKYSQLKGHLLEQLAPLPLYPFLQLQLKEPTVLVQFA